MRNGTADIVFANKSELHSLYETSDFDTALKRCATTSSSAWSPAARRAAWW